MGTACAHAPLTAILVRFVTRAPYDNNPQNKTMAHSVSGRGLACPSLLFHSLSIYTACKSGQAGGRGINHSRQIVKDQQCGFDGVYAATDPEGRRRVPTPFS